MNSKAVIFSPVEVSEFIARSYICKRWMPTISTTATKEVRAVPFIIIIVELSTCIYFGEVTCCFIIELSVGLARHDMVEIGMLKTIR